MRRRPQRPQIEVHNPVRLGQQPRRFRRSFFAKVNRPGQQHQDDKHNGDGELRAPMGHRKGLPLFREAAPSIFSSAPDSRTPCQLWVTSEFALQAMPQARKPKAKKRNTPPLRTARFTPQQEAETSANGSSNEFALYSIRRYRFRDFLCSILKPALSQPGPDSTQTSSNQAEPALFRSLRPAPACDIFIAGPPAQEHICVSQDGRFSGPGLA